VPDLSLWVEAIANEGWKIVNRSDGVIKAHMQIGASQYPVRQSVTWVMKIEKTTSGALVEVHVPAFTDSPYARVRVREKVDKIVNNVTGEANRVQESDIDLLVDMT
jgi:hypothetical protein